jgi:hypothetical protein
LAQLGALCISNLCATKPILSDRYRNRRKRFGLRMNLIAGLINWMSQN